MDKRCMNLNQPNFEGFESLHKFVVHGLHLMTSDYAQALFNSDDKERTREPRNGRGTVRVCRKTLATSVDSDIRLPGRNQASVVLFGSTNRKRLPNTLPECFDVQVDIILLIVENLKRYRIILNDKLF